MSLLPLLSWEFLLLLGPLATNKLRGELSHCWICVCDVHVCLYKDAWGAYRLRGSALRRLCFDDHFDRLNIRYLSAAYTTLLIIEI